MGRHQAAYDTFGRQTGGNVFPLEVVVAWLRSAQAIGKADILLAGWADPSTMPIPLDPSLGDKEMGMVTAMASHMQYRSPGNERQQLHMRWAALEAQREVFGFTEEGRRQAVDLSAEQPDDVRFQMLHAWYEAQAGGPGAGRAILEAFQRERNPRGAMFWIELGTYALNAKDGAAALEAYRKAGLDPQVGAPDVVANADFFVKWFAAAQAADEVDGIAADWQAVVHVSPMHALARAGAQLGALRKAQGADDAYAALFNAYRERWPQARAVSDSPARVIAVAQQ